MFLNSFANFICDSRNRFCEVVHASPRHAKNDQIAKVGNTCKKLSRQKWNAYMLSSSCIACWSFLYWTGKPVSQCLITERLRSNVPRLLSHNLITYNANSCYRNEAFNLLNPSGCFMYHLAGVTRYSNGLRAVRSGFDSKQRNDFLFSKASRPPLGPTWPPGEYFREGKWVGVWSWPLINITETRLRMVEL